MSRNPRRGWTQHHGYDAQLGWYRWQPPRTISRTREIETDPKRTRDLAALVAGVRRAESILREAEEKVCPQIN